MQQIFLSLQCWIVALLDLIHPKSCLAFWQALRCGLMSFALLGEVLAGGGVLFGFSLWSRRWCLEWDFTEDTYSNQINSGVCDRSLGSDSFCHIGETLTLVHQVLWWTFRGSLRRSLECLSGKRCLAVLPFKYYTVCERVCVEFFLAASLPVSFCASVCLSLGAFWAAEWNAGVAETVLWSQLFRLGNLSAGNLGSLVERVCLLWWWGTGWEQGDCPSHFTPPNQTWLVWLGQLVGFILGGFVRDWQQKVWFL